MLANLKRKFSENKSTTKDIYNAITRLKDKKAGQLGSTPIQVLLSLLHDNNYTFQHTTNNVTNWMENLFFVHPTSFNLVRAFPHVFFIGATYKTNTYNMPFVQIVGVTLTSKTFCVVCAFIMDETEVTYKWVLQCLRKTIGECMDVRVILTDRERALINACVDVFPADARLLCRFHIIQNLVKHVEPKFRTQRQWGSFKRRWSILVQSKTIKDYTTNEFSLQCWCKDFPGVYHYVDVNWLTEWKEKFVSCWVDKYLNFRNQTTNRVEDEHALLKANLCGKLTLHKFLGVIDTIISGQLTSIKESFEMSKIVSKHGHNIHCLRLLHGL